MLLMYVMKCYAVGLAICFITTKNVATATTPFCFGGIQYQYYTDTRFQEGGTRECAGRAQALAKVNSLDLIKEMKYHLEPNSEYWVDAQECTSDPTKFCWSDGSLVTVPFEDKRTAKKDCLEYHSKAANEDPIITTALCASFSRYICEKGSNIRSLTKTELLIADASEYHVTCETDLCPPSWTSIDGSALPVGNISQHRVTQGYNESSSSTRLRFQNAAESDSGTYSCNALTSKTVDVKVQGRPNIINIVTSPCSTNATLMWTPGKYAEGFIHRIQLSDGQVFNVTPTNSSEQIFPFTVPSWSTEYTLSITPCTGNCTLNFAPSTRSFLIGGIPQTIAAGMDDEMKCVVTWSSPPTSVNVTVYKMDIMETAVIFRPNAMHTNSWQAETVGMSHEFKIRSNMKYMVSVIADTCDTKGEAIPIQANCSLPPSAPEKVSKPEIINTATLLKPDMKLQLPDESTGLMSCLLVMISDEPNEVSRIVNMDKTYQVNELKTKLSENNDSAEYLAFAISPDKFVNSEGHLIIEIGNESHSSCDLSTNSHDAVAMDGCNGTNICGMNKKLQDSKNYKVHVFAVVNVNDSLSLRRSLYAEFDTLGSSAASSVGGIIGGVVGVLVFLVLLGLLAFIWLKRSKGKGEYDPSDTTAHMKRKSSMPQTPPPRRSPPPPPSAEDS